MRKGEESCSHSDKHPTYRQPAWPLTSTPEITDEDHHQQTSNVKAANQQSRFRASKAVSLLYSGDDTTKVARDHQGLDERQVTHTEQKTPRV